MNLVFLTYNNYYNRIIKKLDTITEYEEAVSSELQQEFYDIQFNPNDGINTEQIVNWGNNNWTPDYLVVYDDTQENNVNIQSRWFVIEWVRTRTGQYKATLHRDVIADNYEQVVDSPVFIEKATVPFESDVAIYNTEDMATNQIKQSEYLLQDKSKSAWLVGYFAKNIDYGTGDDQTNPAIIIPGAGIKNFITVNDLSTWSFFDYTNYGSSNYKLVEDFNITMRFSLYWSLTGWGACRITSKGDAELLAFPALSDGYNGQIYNIVPSNKSERLQFVKSTLLPVLQNNLTTIKTWYGTQQDYKFEDTISRLKDKYIFVETGSYAGYYKITLEDKGYDEEDAYYTIYSSQENYLNAFFETALTDDFTYHNSYQQGDDLRQNAKRYIKYKKYKLVLTPVNASELYIDWPVAATKLKDAPYGMFCIPANPVAIKSGNTSVISSTLTEDEALNAMCAIAERLGTYCYDIQKLPYFPYTDRISADNTIDIAGLTEHLDYEFIVDNSTKAIKESIVIYPNISNFSFDISKSLSIPRYVFDDTSDTLVEDIKLANQCDLYRLCSPNYSATFEFNLAKAGTISNFNVDCSYKPYNPYIHINPDWSNLYGQDFDDYRGLICQGDFSIPRINDQWQNYMISNKNYLNAFNRQIDSIELNNSIQHKKDVLNAFTGTASGAVGGAIAGAKVGGPYGAIAGAAIGGTASYIGGQLDVYYNEMLRNDALDLTKDQFGYNLKNIQALPDTLAKISTYDKNNKIWPVLEYYTCTNQEKQALVNKMRYNGMTVMRIGRIWEFQQENRTYIKAKLIRSETIVDDYHVMTAIADELNKGVFI